MSFIKRFKLGKSYELDEPLKFNCHSRPTSRRDVLAQGFKAGLGTVVAPSLLGLAASNRANALSSDLQQRLIDCNITAGAGKIPFICFDLAGGANVAGSNVLVGGPGGQKDMLSTAGYGKQGLPGDMIPGQVEATPTATSNGDHTDDTLGLSFHSDSQFLAGILEKTSVGTQANINGAVIAARSENDTGNNPHNPMYAISLAGARGQLLSLVGSRSSESGGNSMAPISVIRSDVRPTKIDRASDVTGLVDVGDFGALTPEQVVSVMESVSRISDAKLDVSSLGLSDRARSDAIKLQSSCAYVKSAYLAEQFPNPAALDPAADTDIVGGANSIFTADEFNSDREFQKTASVMKLVLNGQAGAGTIAMGGYDYHTGERSTGERRDLRAGRCMGACLEYAARRGVPLMMYVYSDGSVFSNGMLDNSEGGRGKGVWTGDNQQTASAFFLLYNPNGRSLTVGGATGANGLGTQLGYMRPSGDVETSSSPAANNVPSLVGLVTMNYLALHGEQASFLTSGSPYQGISQGFTPSSLDNFTAFAPVLGPGQKVQFS